MGEVHTSENITSRGCEDCKEEVEKRSL